LLFPFITDGRVVYVQARLFGGFAKFIGPRGIAKPPFNTECLRCLKTGTDVHICEGIPDAIALEGFGRPAVGILGARSFRDEWVDRFLNFNVILTRDGDAAGAAFVRRVSRAFRARGKPVRTLTVPNGTDVAGVIAAIRAKR